MALKTVTYVDPDGRKWFRSLPEHVPEAQAKAGIPLGPPSLKDLGLPKEIEIRLHNQLAERGILTERDARKRLTEVSAALMAALSVDVHEILAIYQGQGAEERSA